MSAAFSIRKGTATWCSRLAASGRSPGGRRGRRQNYEMPDAPRSNNEKDSIGGWRPLGFVSLALQKGYRLAFEASSDHVSTHISYCNLWVTLRSREGIMD